MDSIRIQADEAKRLKNDTAFQQFVQDVRDVQISIFSNSAAEETKQREEAHAIMRALNQIEMQLDAAIAAERMLDRHK
jgi:hypothetical protein|tara:strand:- start:12410 stop:12643 length:234 start_codon:yes stop_codon:yes gene_type:complete